MDVRPLDMTALTGVVEYDPDEFVVTAKAGTTVGEIADLLEAQSQYMPFDPPFIPAGATLGGTIASGLSGPGRQRYGGIRDFLLGVRFVDGTGTLVRSGGKVVKNAAGFDFPKLLIGSLGRLGVLVELTLKVFPRPATTASMRLSCGTLEKAVETLCGIAAGAWEVGALDLEPPATLVMRMGGHPEALQARFARLADTIGVEGERLTEEEDRAYWRSLRDCGWGDDHAALVKVPITPAGVIPLDQRLDRLGAARRYSVAGNVAWVGLEETSHMATLEEDLRSLGLAGLVLRGESASVRLGANPAASMERLVKTTLDPEGRFPS
jgi:glycolate oxidase FAD binding subunit